jgi:hypothetical protein
MWNIKATYRTPEEAAQLMIDKAEYELAEVKRKNKRVKFSENEITRIISKRGYASRSQTFDDIQKLKEVNRELKRQLDSITLFSLIKKLFTGK